MVIFLMIFVAFNEYRREFRPLYFAYVFILKDIINRIYRIAKIFDLI